MELRHLRYFVAVAEELSFRRAAQRLRLAQPALSMQIKSLESKLGVQLFERSSRFVRLTHAGAAFLGEARGVLSSAQRAEDLVRRADRGIIGTLRIGAIAPAATARLAALLRTYREDFPEVDLSLHELTSATQIDQLLMDQIDVGFLRPPIDHRQLATRFLEEAPMVLAVYAGHRFAKKKQLQWKDFHNEPLVMIQPNLQHGYYDKFMSLCSEAGARPTVRQYGNDVQIVMWLISAGLGISPATQTLADIKRPGLIFRPLPPGVPMVQTLVVWKRSNPSPLLREFLQRLPSTRAGKPHPSDHG